MDWVNYVLTIVSGLAVLIPLLLKLIEYVQKATKEKNWNSLLGMVVKLIEQAEQKFTDGADRREWVLAMVKASADTINFDVDYQALGALIDMLCGMAKKVNVATEDVK